MTKCEPMKIIYSCFPGGRNKVLTMSFDDGRGEDRQLVELFDRYGIRGTFNANGGLVNKGRIPLAEYPAVYKGHEVACHTYQHPTIARCPSEQVAAQILADRRALEEIMGCPVRGLAYPNGSYSRRVMELLPGLGIRYARTIHSTESFDMPENLFEWNPTCHFKNNLMELGRQFAALEKPQYLNMMYVWGHSYEFPILNAWGLMEEFCGFIGGRADIWYATNIEIVDYMAMADRLQYTAAGDRVFNPSFASVWLSVDGVPREIPGGQTVQLF